MGWPSLVAHVGWAMGRVPFELRPRGHLVDVQLLCATRVQWNIHVGLDFLPMIV